MEEKTLFSFLSERCVGCYACVTACMDEHDDFVLARRFIASEETGGAKPHIVWYSYACLHCFEPECAKVCPMGCFTVDPETHIVKLNAENCIGCGACAAACEHKAIAYGPDRKAFKCDGCAELTKQGLEPRCVSACPRGAIKKNG